ncbi:YsnF/AvaK domain-containing protein [Paracoccus liaowanqingii]|nr:YsnF/AvaK domain-containing protein [Paracoccus liaowanqingii]
MTYDNETSMTGAANRSVSAMFDSRAEAQAAVDRLKGTGVSDNQVRMTEGATDTATTGRAPEQDKGFWDSLSDFFFPDEDRYTYAEGLSRGGCLVTVSNLTSAEYDMVLDILDDEGTIDLDAREADWRSEGWGGYESSPYAAGGMAADTGRAPATTDQDSIPVVEEQLTIGKRDTSHGRVRVRAYTVEEPVSETVNLREERVELERRPVDRAVTGTEAAFQDRTIEAEEYAEEAVVSKEARVVEEIALRKVSDTHQETVSDTVRHTEVEVEDDRTAADRTGLNPTRK